METGGADETGRVGTVGESPSPIAVLLVDDEPEFAATAASLLETHDDRLDVTTETDPRTALSAVESATYHCVVSDYDMSGVDGIELLERIRAEHGDLPFVLFTGKGSERVASDALAADVDAYLTKGVDDPFSTLASRVIDAVHSARTERRLEQTSVRLEALYEGSPDMIDIHDAAGTVVDVNRAMVTELGYDREELVGMKVWEIDEQINPEESTEEWQSLDVGETLRLETTFARADGSTLPVEVHVRRIDVQGEDRFLVNSRDISDRKAYERRIERENERLDEFASIVSHDLRNPLNVVSGYLTLARETGDEVYFDRCKRAVHEMERLIEDVLTLARQGDDVGPVEPVALDRLTDYRQTDAFGSVTTSDHDDDGSAGDIEVVFEIDARVLADPSRLKRLLENLFRNAAEHGGDRVVVGPLANGFYVADDGPGIAEDRRERVFESGHTTSDSGTGFGLAIVERIAEAHGWEVTLTESESGGARFEFRGVDTA